MTLLENFGNITSQVERARHRHKEALPGFVRDYADREATVYTDNASAYESLSFDHDVVGHSQSEPVSGAVRTYRIESPWSTLKRAHMGTFHKLSPKHLERYGQESAGRRNFGELDTIAQTGMIAQSMARRRLRNRQLIADNSLPSGARA